jgi:dihydroorotase
MVLMLKNAHVIDPQVGLDKKIGIVIKDGRIDELTDVVPEGVEVIDLAGRIVIPGLVDVHVHLREPGFEYKEDIASGTRSATKGGFTQICAMPNVEPCIDDAVGVEYVKAIAEKQGTCKVSVSGACTKEQGGEILADIGDMYAHGVRVFTDDGRGIQKAGIMRLVMDYASQFDCTVMVHAQDESLSGDGQVNEGVVSTRLGMLGWPAEAEEIEIERDIALCRLSNCPLHIQHITTARGLELVKRAKEEGLRVTCEVTPHHMFLCEDDIDDTYPTFLKVNPPLRTKEDANALIEGVKNGIVDMIATDHAPHAEYEKDREFELAPFGMTGLESALGAVLTNLVHTGDIDYNRLVELMCINPRKLLHEEPVKIEAGSIADLTVFDPNIEWTCGSEPYESQASNCGFDGKVFKGRATDVFVNGKQALKDGVVCD